MLSRPRPSIALEDVSFTYPGRSEPALDSFTFTFESGRLYAILGRNGSGKSTLARCLNALLLPDRGTVTLGGLDTVGETSRKEVCRRVSMVFQNPDTQMVGPTVEEEVAFGPENLGLTVAEIRARVDDAMERTGVSPLARRQPLRLSRGQKQQVAFAGALAMDPDFLISDESTSMLDYAARARILAIFAELRAGGMGIIHATHFMEEAVSADEVLVLDSGRLVSAGAPGEVLADAAAVRRLGLEPLTATCVVEELRALGFDAPRSILTVEEFMSWLNC